MTDSAGNVTDTYSYDAWGNVTSHIGSTSQPYQFVGQLGYYTHWMEPNLGLMQLGVRFYDSAVGRFTRRDAVLTETSFYTYAHCSPLLKRDPTGLYPTLTYGASCRNQVANMSSIMNWVEENMRKYLNDDALKASVANCKAHLMIQCWKGPCLRLKGVCGMAVAGDNVVRVTIQMLGCPPMACTILHEIVHACGLVGHNRDDWGRVVVPGCGELSQLGSRGKR